MSIHHVDDWCIICIDEIYDIRYIRHYLVFGEIYTYLGEQSLLLLAIDEARNWWKAAKAVPNILDVNQSPLHENILT